MDETFLHPGGGRPELVLAPRGFRPVVVSEAEKKREHITLAVVCVEASFLTVSQTISAAGELVLPVLVIIQLQQAPESWIPSLLSSTP